MKHEFKEVGPCPRCGGPGEYTYIIEWPAGEDEDNVIVTINFSCTVCGYKISSEKIVIPIKALYLLRALMIPKTRPFIEKIFLASKIRLTDDNSLNK